MIRLKKILSIFISTFKFIFNDLIAKMFEEKNHFSNMYMLKVYCLFIVTFSCNLSENF